MSFTRKLLAGAFSVGMVAGWATVASADNVQNDVGSTGSDSIVAGGTTSVGYEIKATGAGTACDAADGSPSPSRSSAPGATATPSSLVFIVATTLKFVSFGSSLVGKHGSPLPRRTQRARTTRTLQSSLLPSLLSSDPDTDSDGVPDCHRQLRTAPNATRRTPTTTSSATPATPTPTTTASPTPTTTASTTRTRTRRTTTRRFGRRM